MSAAKAKISSSKPKPLRIMVLGQGGVGKSALVVRFITRRYIGEYDPTLEKLYTYHTVIDSEAAHLEILDTAGQPHECECPTLEANIRWAEAFILMYSVTDKCSFDECNRLKFLINYNKRRRRFTSKIQVEAPVVLVGNKVDQIGDRMVTFEEGRRRSVDIGCASFHEISVREHIEEVCDVFRDVVRCWRAHTRCPKLKRSSSDLPQDPPSSPADHPPLLNNSLGSEWRGECTDTLLPFRDRAHTDGNLLASRPRTRWRHLSPRAPSPPLHDQLTDRRMSISMRGTSSAAF